MEEEQVIYVALGGNIGDTHQVFDEAIMILSQYIEITAQSDRFVTKAMYQTQQDNFLNMAIRAVTNMGPQELLTVFKDVEKRFGRDFNAERYTARPLDIDLLYYGTNIIDTPNLTVPHPFLHERGFVLEPLVQVVKGNFSDPITGKTPVQMLSELFSSQSK